MLMEDDNLHTYLIALFLFALHPEAPNPISNLYYSSFLKPMKCGALWDMVQTCNFLQFSCDSHPFSHSSRALNLSLTWFSGGSIEFAAFSTSIFLFRTAEFIFELCAFADEWSMVCRGICMLWCTLRALWSQGLKGLGNVISGSIVTALVLTSFTKLLLSCEQKIRK